MLRPIGVNSDGNPISVVNWLQNFNFSHPATPSYPTEKKNHVPSDLFSYATSSEKKKKLEVHSIIKNVGEW
jgi:hypothetical protein